jgi:hypothetical protein
MPDPSFLLTSSSRLDPVSRVDEQVADGGTIDLDASRTVELRPSNVEEVRTGGPAAMPLPAPPSHPASDEAATDAQQKPVLASRRSGRRFGPRGTDLADKTDA